MQWQFIGLETYSGCVWTFKQFHADEKRRCTQSVGKGVWYRTSNKKLFKNLVLNMQ